MGVLLVAGLALSPVRAGAAEIVLARSGVEKLVTQALFRDHGRLTLAPAPCASYLDQPSVSLSGGRIHIRSHLTARVGFAVNADCVGIGLASWTTVSGTPVSAGGKVRLEDIRIDEVDDPDTRTLLVNSGLSGALPKAVELDIQSAVRTLLVQSVDQIQATVESFSFQDVSVVNDTLSMRFDFKLVGR
jgi:hypothetical protein